jgi:deoxyribodipyrimidine photo-lyase
VSLEKKVRLLQNGNPGKGPVIYWMSRDQRVLDNYALLFSQQLAFDNNTFLVIVFALQSNFLGSTLRQFDFMINGLIKIEKSLNELNIPFFVLFGKPEITIPDFINEVDAKIIVSDFDPIKIKRIWKREIAKKIIIPFYEVDTHNIVPCLLVSQKQEFAAYTIRPKINKLLDEFLIDIPEPRSNNFISFNSEKIDWENFYNKLDVDKKVRPVTFYKSGEDEAFKTLNDFLNNKFENYNENRNDPSLDGLSNLSPYLHFGQISSQRIALIVNHLYSNHRSAKTFLEELIIRKELSDNYCYYNTDYDNFNGFPDWAKTSLREHSKDSREVIYSIDEFEHANTHDDLWNAAQTEMLVTGKMHGYMRMYWAKKIIEWSESPQEALKIAIYLNDKFQLDGNDPNGYVGCAWSIGGLHDRPWFERKVFGKIRYMNRSGAERKFDVNKYINKIKSLTNKEY